MKLTRSLADILDEHFLQVKDDNCLRRVSLEKSGLFVGRQHFGYNSFPEIVGAAILINKEIVSVDEQTLIFLSSLIEASVPLWEELNYDRTSDFVVETKSLISFRIVNDSGTIPKSIFPVPKELRDDGVRLVRLLKYGFTKLQLIWKKD